MTAKDLLLANMDVSLGIFRRYLSDLDDRDLLRRPVPGANHLAWQLGHLIASEHRMVELVAPGSMPPLPEGFLRRHDKQAVACDDPAEFLDKRAYLELWERQRAGTKEVLARLPEAELDRPGPEPVRSYAPSVGAVFLVIGSHPLMHAGQVAVLRRLLGKPIVI